MPLSLSASNLVVVFPIDGAVSQCFDFIPKILAVYDSLIINHIIFTYGKVVNIITATDSVNIKNISVIRRDIY